MNDAAPTGDAQQQAEERFLRQAIDLAVHNVDRGQLPFGALVVRGGELLADGVNTALRDVDPTAHAEVAAIRRACSSLQTLDLSGATIYSSCEPCAICLSGAAGVGICEIVYAAPKELVPDLGVTGPEDTRRVVGFQDALRLADPAALRHVPTADATAPFDRWLARGDGR